LPLEHNATLKRGVYIVAIIIRGRLNQRFYRTSVKNA